MTQYEVLADELAGHKLPAPEAELLVRCSSVTLDTATARRIRALLQENVDWELLLQLATRHQVAPLVGTLLCTHFADACPPEVIGELRTCLREIASRNLFLSGELIRLLALFESRGIRAIPYKGPLLASRVYGQLGLRSFCDLDVLVQRGWNYQVRVPEVLRGAGWTMISDYGHEVTFADATGRVHLDVHQSLSLQSLMPFRLNFEELWLRCIATPFMGATVKALAPEDLLIALCVQLVKDTGDEELSPRLIKICDIAQLVDRYPGLDWSWATSQARRLGGLRMLCVGSVCASRLFGTILPEAIARESAAIPRFASLVHHVEQRVMYGRIGPFSRHELTSRSTWHRELREREQDRSTRGETHRPILMPNRNDYAWVRLPEILFPLYFAVRPLRLAAKFIRALGRKLLS